MFHKDTVIQIWNVPADHNEAFPAIIGCLPKGEWTFEKDRGYGKVEDTFITFQLINECSWEEKKDRISILVRFRPIGMGLSWRLFLPKMLLI